MTDAGETKGMLRTAIALGRATRPLAQANIAPPILVGAAAAVWEGAAWNARWLAVALAFGVIDHVVIMYANDYGDRETDSDARTPFSGGSGVLVEGLIAPETLRRAATIAAFALLALGGAVWDARPALLPAAVAALALLHAYSFPPLRLSHRPVGASLQAAGVGLVLPIVGYHALGGGIAPPLWILTPMVLWGLAGNITTAIPDIGVDEAAGKRTIAVALGDSRARQAAIVALLVAVGLASMGAFVAVGWDGLAIAASLLPALAHRADESPTRFVFIQGACLSAMALALAWSLGH